MPKLVFRPARTSIIDPQLQRALIAALAVGLALVLLLPAARSHSDWLGWIPLWLVGMPAVALWSLHRFRLPLRRVAAPGLPPRRRRPGAQARRRALPAAPRWARVA
jgi:predicted MFS family arabinose efflux permease